MFARPRALVLSRPDVIIVLGIAFALILGTTLLTAFSTRGTLSADQRAAHAQQSLGAALQWLATVSDATTAARSAILTGEERPLDRFRSARLRYRGELAALRGAFDHQDGLAPVFAELQQLAEARFAALDEALALFRARGVLPALAVIDAAESTHSADEIRRLVAVLQRQEFTELAEQSADASQRAATIHKLNLGLLLVAGALAIAVVRWLARRTRDADTMVTVCAWTRRVNWQGRWISFEEYLIKRFDVRCTHGICDEAAAKMKAEAEKLHVPAELRRKKSKRAADVPFSGAHSTAPFA